MRKKFSFIAFIAAVIWSLGLNYANLYVYQSECDEPGCQTSGYIFGADDYWYQIPAYNLVEHGELNYLLGDKELAVRRTPIYPLFIAAQLALWNDEVTAFRVLVHIQLLLMALGAVLLGRAAWLLTNRTDVGKIVTWMAVFFPVWHLNTFTTMTEGFYPALVCIFLYCFAIAITNFSKKSLIGFGIAGLMMGICILTRPLTAVVGVAAGLSLGFIFRYEWNTLLRVVWVYCFGILIILSPWIVRNYYVTGEFVALEKYYNFSPTEWGAGLKGLQQFESTFQNPNIEAGYVGKLFKIVKNYENSLILTKISDSLAQDYIEKRLPDDIKSIIDVQEFAQILKSYNLYFISIIKQANRYITNERFSINKVLYKLNQDNSNKNKQLYYYNFMIDNKNKVDSNFILKTKIITPIYRLYLLTFHSFTFQKYLTKKYDNIISKILVFFHKLILFLLIISLFFSTIFILLIKIKNYIKFLIIFPVTFTAFYLCWISGYVEVRYMLQTYPLMMISLGIGLVHILQNAKVSKICF